MRNILTIGTMLILLFGSCSESKKRSVLIIDMPIQKEKLERVTAKKIKSITNIAKPLDDYAECGQVGRNLEKYFETALNGDFHKLGAVKFQDRFESFANYFHGYHVANTILEGAEDIEAHFLGLPPAISVKSKMSFNEHLNTQIPLEQNMIREKVAELRPEYVNLSGSESIDINMSILMESGLDEKVALRNAKAIFNKWNVFWKSLISDHPDTTFVVAAGNGESDWVGDSLDEKESYSLTTPATIDLPNVVVIGSSNGTTRSAFSNYGETIDFYESGEKRSAAIPCETHKELSLTGTSQATAVYLNKILKE